jgi:translation initiation factor 2 gamma subunit (eIF-2gamma)
MGYFSHGKSAIVNGITGNQTSLHKIEIKRNII